MESKLARANILNKITEALKAPVTMPFPEQISDRPVFIPHENELAIEFAEKFTSLLGKFVYCENESELVNKLAQLIHAKEWKKIYSIESGWLDDMKEYSFDPVTTDDLAACDASITLCEHLIARTGTIVLSSQQESGRVSSVYAPIHICVAYSHQLVFDIADSLQQFKDNIEQMPSMISFASGPSRTADIEKTLVVGVHGPKEVYCFFVDKGIA